MNNTSLDNVYIAIMAGGSGTRFWPKSRTSFPKQFLDVMGTGKTLLQKTFQRSLAIVPAERILILTNHQYASIVREQLVDIPHENILSEPLRKNTAPALTLLTYFIHAKDASATLVALPSDHLIEDEEQFNTSLKTAIDFAKHHDALLTLGIVPTSPHTGYGYIQKGELANPDFGDIFKVRTFTEKPPLEMAQQFMDSGDFFWNAGIFVWNVASGLKAINTYMTTETQAFNRYFNDFVDAPTSAEKDNLLKKIFEQCRNISIDYALLEHARNVYVEAAYFDWSDLGSWTGVYDLRKKDQHLNSVNHEKTTILLNTSRCLIDTPPHKLTVIDGLDDYIVVNTNEALLICKKSDAQKIKEYLDIVKDSGHKNYL